MKTWAFGEVCEHGSLGRKCPICERDEEIELLRACIAAADCARGSDCCPVCDSEPGHTHWIDCPWRDYDAARKEVEP